MLEVRLVIVALCLIDGGFLWRSLSRRARAKGLVAELSDPDAKVRAHAVEGLTEASLGEHASLLLDLARHDDDVRVRGAIATAATRHQWEPSDSTQLVELRRVVAEWIARGHVYSVPKPSAPAAPAGPVADGAAGPAAQIGLHHDRLVEAVTAALPDHQVHEVRLRGHSSHLVLTPVPFRQVGA